VIVIVLKYFLLSPFTRLVVKTA